VDHFAWTVAAASADPFLPRRPQGSVCEDGSFRPEISFEEQVIEINTARCDYLTLVQPAKTSVMRGEILYIRLWHYNLTAPSGGAAYIAVGFGDCLMLEEPRPIPSLSRVTVARFPAPISIAAGTPIYFHVDNHGANTYDLVEVSVGGSLLEAVD
jgi:hypothetical protein